MMRYCRRGNISFAQIKSPESSASETEYMTNLMIWVIVRMGLPIEGMGTSFDSMVWAPEQLQEHLKLRQTVSELTERIMLLARLVILSLGCVAT